MFISILDYSTNSVVVREVPKELEDASDDEILEGVNFGNLDCSFVISDTMEVDVKTKKAKVNISLE